MGRSAVESNDRTVEHRVFDDVLSELRELVRLARPRRKWHLSRKALLLLLGQRRHHRRFEYSGSDGDHADAKSGKLPCDGQNETGYAGFAGRIGGLADLTFEGGDGGGSHDDAPFAIVARLIDGHGCGRQSQNIERADEIDFDRTAKGIEAVGALTADDALGMQHSGAMNNPVKARNDRCAVSIAAWTWSG